MENLIDIIKRLAHEQREEVIGWRRWMHQHPELSQEEYKTMEFIAERLRGLGLEPRTGIGKTGCMAIRLAMVPFFIIDMLMGEDRPTSISGGSICDSVAAKDDGMNSCGSMSIFAMPRLALKVRAVPLTVGKYLVKASRRCWWAARPLIRPPSATCSWVSFCSIPCSSLRRRRAPSLRVTP